MNRRGSLTLVAILFLLVTSSIVVAQVQSFQAERAQKKLLIKSYQQRTWQIEHGRPSS